MAGGACAVRPGVKRVRRCQLSAFAEIRGADMTLEPLNDEVPRVLVTFRDKFFSASRLASFPWAFVEKELGSSKSTNVISKILKQTCCHHLCTKFPPSVKYRRLFITELIKRLEATDCDPLDELYDALGEVVGAEETRECYKSYFLSGGGAVTVQEKVALISEGTTGLVTWEAALHLAEWALENQHFFTNRSVLELGSGVGLTGIMVCASCRPSRFTFSDCHPSVLHKLTQNLLLNSLDQEVVRVEELNWASVTEERLKDVGADTIIAADVVYDPVVVETLVSLLSRLITSSNPDVFICSTVRNTDTYRGFTQQLENAEILYKVLPGPGRVFPYNRDSNIEIIKLYKKR